MLEHSWRTFPGWIPIFIPITILEMGRAGRAILVMGIKGTESLRDRDSPLPHIQITSQGQPVDGLPASGAQPHFGPCSPVVANSEVHSRLLALDGADIPFSASPLPLSQLGGIF